MPYGDGSNRSLLMKVGLKRGLWLWLPPLILFLSGLKRAWLTGQTDPWDWAFAAAVVLVGTGWMMARRGWRMLGWVAMGGVGMALVFCILAAGRVPDALAAAGLVAVALLATVGGAFLYQPPFASGAVEKRPRHVSRLRPKRMAIGLASLSFAALIFWRGPPQPVQPVPNRPGLAVVTGLPLFWAESGRDGPLDAPIITLLRTRFTVMPMDDPLRLAMSGARRLLLAQPRPLTPAQRVAIDQWVRDGGTALVLADPLLRWPSDLPPGDRRRAPSADLLQPLLRHWGFEPTGREEAEIRHFLPDGALLTLSGAQLYRLDEGDAAIHRKRIGRGEVLLLGDADPIDDRLWLADPAHPLDPRFWVADTPARVVHWLGGAPVPGDRRWMGKGQDVTAALRWALLAGTIWAILGAFLLRRENKVSGRGTKRET